MNIIKRIYLFFLFHQRNYRLLLKLTNFPESQKIENINPINLHYQGYASFFTKNYHHSQMCFELLMDKGKLTSKECNLLAYMYSRHNEKENAISTWCLALEKNKNNKIAKKSLDYVRAQGREVNLIEDEFFDSNIPKQPFLIPLTLIGKLILIFILLIFLSVGIYFGILKIREEIAKNRFRDRDEINKIHLPDYNPNLLEKAKDNELKYSYSEKEIKNKFQMIKRNILDDKVVAAQIEINQIRMSNASLAVKYKMDILETFIKEPDYAVFKNKISFKNFLSEQILYQNVYILWKGRVVNLSKNNYRIIFDFIIGDEEKGIIEGIIPVVFKKAVIVKNNQKIGIFGKIKIDQDDIYIDGKFVLY